MMHDCFKRLIKKIDKIWILVGRRPHKIIENQENPRKIDKDLKF